MDYKVVVPPSQKRPITEYLRPSQLQSLFYALRFNFSVFTWCLVGACIQSLLILTIPAPYALLPSAFLLCSRILGTLLMVTGYRRNHHMDGVMKKKVSAQIRNPDGEVPEATSAQGIVVLILGAKSNGPLGLFEPEFKIIGDYIHEMSVIMSDLAADNGFLGQSGWTSMDSGIPELMVLSYWRSVSDLHAFAQSPLHREAWTWWERTLKQHDYLGIFHEIYHAPAKHWETIYVNFQPTLLGATTYLKKKGGDGNLEGGIVSEEWVSPLVDASRGKLRTSKGRLDWSRGHEYDQYGENVYADH